MKQLQPDNLGVYQAPKDMPGAICAVTQAVFEDEPCLLLAERNLLSEDSKMRYRYQILKVIREDRPVNAFICLGLAGQFAADEITVAGAAPQDDGTYILCNTVAELRDVAEYLRNQEPLPVEAPPLQEMWWEQVDQKTRFKSKPSTFGYGGQLVRPG
jgi:hypothetical protein